MVARAAIDATHGDHHAIARQLCALYAVDREGCGLVWRCAFERAFGAVPGAQDGEDTTCPYLLGVNTWREALQRTYKAMYAVPKNDAWMWAGIKSWSQREMDARLALLGTVPSGAIADLLRARGASILRFNRQIVKSQDLISNVTEASGSDDPLVQEALLIQALRLIDIGGANPAYADPTGRTYPALHRACMGTSVRPVSFLLGVGARMLINYNHGGRTPLMLAKERAIWEELLRQGAGPNHWGWARDQNGQLVELQPAYAGRSVQPAGQGQRAAGSGRRPARGARRGAQGGQGARGPAPGNGCVHRAAHAGMELVMRR